MPNPTYPKIQTVYERGEDFAVGDISRRPEYELIYGWTVTEKIDGTNIRIHCDGQKVRFGGRTDNAQIPVKLLDPLTDHFTAERFAPLMAEHDLTEITLYGEGYGAGIQRGGGNYRPDPFFVLFDVLIGESAWLDDGQVTDVAERMGIERVPILLVGAPLEVIRELVGVGFQSHLATTQRPAEGIVARPSEPLFDRRGGRVMFKLKTADFVSKPKRRRKESEDA